VTTRAAEWRPGWYELDQPIEIGLAAEFAFFPLDPPQESCSVLQFYNTLWHPEEAIAARGVIAKITHRQLGPLRRVDTEGLEYTFVLLDGRELVVNAEEEPGKIYEPIDGEWRAAPQQFDDWTLAVEFAELGPLGPAPQRLGR
jgi:hypothetical protein